MVLSYLESTDGFRYNNGRKKRENTDMKRLFACALCILMLLPLCACSSSLAVNETATVEEVVTAAKKPEKKEDPYAITTDPISLPEGNCVGYCRVDVTPEQYPIYISSGMNAKKALDPLYFTVVAFSDGETAALMIGMDLKGMGGEFYTKCTKAIEEVSGIPASHVFLNATHNHNAPAHNSTAVANIRWQALCLKRLKWAVREALTDLSPATAEIGHADTTGFAFVRRYICADGSLQGIHHRITTGSPVVKHETEADPDLQAIRFQRDGKKDVVMVNWQAHAAHAAISIKDAVTADFIKEFRDGAEEKYDIHFAYYNGASGNINFSTKFPELKAVQGGYKEIGTALVGKLGEALSNMEKVSLGKVGAVASKVDGVIRKDDPARLAEAQICQSANEKDQDRLLEQYGFQSKYEANYMVARSNSKSPRKLPVSAISFGELGFAANSCEMFDTNAMEVKAASPFKMTFVCAYTNGSNGYIPSAFAFDRGGYEVDTTYFVKGTGELLAQELVRLLSELHSAS